MATDVCLGFWNMCRCSNCKARDRKLEIDIEDPAKKSQAVLELAAYHAAIGLEDDRPSFHGNTAADPPTPENTLTVAKIQALLATIPKVEPTGIDLYGSPLILEGAWQISTPFLADLIPESRGRKVLVVPKSELLAWYDRLRRLGADVRLEPRTREPEKKDAGA